jgi:hypothetical protein
MKQFYIVLVYLIINALGKEQLLDYFVKHIDIDLELYLHKDYSTLKFKHVSNFHVDPENKYIQADMKYEYVYDDSTQSSSVIIKVIITA